MKSVARRIVDRHVVHLVKQWLEAPVAEDDGYGTRKRTTANRDTGRGTPQGAPISPLLSNLYMRRFILGWKLLGYERCWSARIVNYADDCVPRRQALTSTSPSHAAQKMRKGPSKPPCRWRLQITVSCVG